MFEETKKGIDTAGGDIVRKDSIGERKEVRMLWKKR